MGALIILLLIIAFTVLWILWAPLSLTIDTETNVYKIKWAGIAWGAWHPDEAGYPVRIWVMGYRKEYSLVELMNMVDKKSASKTSRTKSKRKNTISGKRMLKYGWKVLNSFEIQRFKCWWDTDNYYWNGLLFPVFHFIGGEHVAINFSGQQVVQITIKNRIIRIIYHLIK